MRRPPSHAVGELLREARAQGWTATRMRSGHIRLEHPSGAVVRLSSSPSCPNALRRVRADMRRALRLHGVRT